LKNEERNGGLIGGLMTEPVDEQQYNLALLIA